MPHILRTIPSYFPHVSGPANQARAISQGLTPLGFDSTVVTTSFGAETAPRQEVLDGVHILRAPVRTGLMQYHIAPQAWRTIRAQSFDLIHVHSYRNFLADVAAVTASHHNTPLIIHLHGTLVGYRAIAQKNRWWVYGAYDLLTRPLGLLRHAQIIVSTSEEAHETEHYGIERSRIHIIPMGINPDHYHFADVRRDPMHIAFVGRLTEDRNPEQLIRALAMIQHLPWSCSLVGDEIRRSYTTSLGYVGRLKQVAQELGIHDRITFTGQLYDAQLRRAYASAGVFVYPSRYENFGQTILEAAAAGCVPITTRVGVAHDLITDGRSGFFIDDTAPEALAQRIAWLLEHPEQQRAIGDAARARTEREYAWAPILQRYADLYDDMIQRSHAAHNGSTWHPLRGGR